MNNRERFYNMINQTNLSHYWDQKSHELKVDLFGEDLKMMSSREAMFARFVANIWFGEEKYFFNTIEAAKTLDPKHIQIITNWLQNPYWP